LHARPSARIELPAIILYVALENFGVSRDDEFAHLRKLPNLATLSEQFAGNFLRVPLGNMSLKWERHSEFTRYSLVSHDEHPDEALQAWLAQIPGQTICALRLQMQYADLEQTSERLAQAQQFFGHADLVGSFFGAQRQALAFTDFRLCEDGFEKFLVLAQHPISPTRAGRISQRVLEFETYRLMALKGFPVSKALTPVLSKTEAALLDMMGKMESHTLSDQALLDDLMTMAVQVEQLISQHGYRFSATQAYHAIVQQRLAELRQSAMQGTQTLGEFLERRLSPAMATVQASALRLVSLSERIARASDLLRTRVNIATEEQNRQLLEKLTQGQELQLTLQSTVEGLSIAAISYYMVSLVLYAAKALKAMGLLSLNPEMVAGLSIPLVLLLVWRIVRKIHHNLRNRQH
jgi:uncharacterized membrane-anchored protein